MDRVGMSGGFFAMGYMYDVVLKESCGGFGYVG